MTRLLNLAVCFLAVSISLPSLANDTSCSKKQYKKLISETNIAFQLEDYALARTHGEKALSCGKGFAAHSKSRRFIKLLNRLNHTYKELGKLQEVTDRLQEAYSLSKTHLGNKHETTMESRDLYYEALIADKKYHSAIPLALENINIAEGNSREEFRLHHYLIQLYSLYALTGQYDKEAETLLTLVSLSRQLFGADDEDTQKYILDLAKNYCRQGANEAFEKWADEHKLQYRCG